MLYESYAEKIKRFAAVRDKILKFKFLIIGVLVANFVLTVCFLATQGMMLGGIRGDTEYTYGNDVKFNATALFALRPTMEYSADGEKWEKEAPVMPGEYKVRAVTHRLFVIPQRSKPVDFVINKKDLILTLEDTELEWRELPTVRTSGLVRGDVLSSVNVDVDNTGIGEANADIVENTAFVTSKDGNDVTSAYNITAEDTVVSILEKLLTLKANDAKKMYDGTSVQAKGYSIVNGGVFDGHKLDVSFSEPALTNVGRKNIKITGVKIFEGSEDVTAFYRVVTQDGVAEVTKRPVRVVAGDFVKVYDGKMINLTEKFALYDADGDDDLPAGDTWEVSSSYEVINSNLIDPQEIIGYIGSVRIENAFEEDVSFNYDIEVDNGNIKISKRPLTLKAVKEEKTYDGDTFAAYRYEPIAAGALAVGDSITVKMNSPVLKNAGSEGIRFSSVSVKSSRGDVTHCYEISKTGATAVIKPISIKITMLDLEKEYDGNRILLSSPANYTVDGKFVSGHGIAVELINPDEYIYACRDKAFDVRYYITVGGSKNTAMEKNYDVKVVNNAKITITSRIIYVSANDISGLTYSAKDIKISDFIGSKIKYDHCLGKQYEFTVDFTKKYRNAGTFDYTLDCRVWQGGEDVTDEFDINVTYTGAKSSKIVIAPYEVTVSLRDYGKIYDGITTLFRYEDCINVSSPLLGGDKLTVNGFVDCTNVNRDSDGNVIPHVLPITHSFTLVTGSAESNYRIIYANGKHDVRITIYPYEVKVTLKDVNKIYDGDVVQYAQCISVDRQLVGSDSLTIVGFKSGLVNVQRDADGKVIPYELPISHKFTLYGGSIEGNYDIIYVGDKHNVKITVEPVDVLITANDYVKMYDAKKAEFKNVNSVTLVKNNGTYTYKDKDSYALIGSDTLTLGFGGNAEYVDVVRQEGKTSYGYYSYTVDWKVNSKNTGNYDVSVDYTNDQKKTSKVTIVPVLVQITALDYEKVYDATYVSVNDSQVNNITVSTGYSDGKYTSYREIFVDDAAAKTVYYYLDSAKNDKINIIFGNNAEYINVLRDADGNVIDYLYTVEYTVVESKDKTVTDRIIDNYDVVIAYTSDSNDDQKLDCSCIRILPISVSVSANNVSRYYDGTEYKITDSGLLTVKVSDTYDFETKKYISYSTVGLATLDGKQQSYYDIFKYKEGKTDKIAKIAFAFVESQEIKNVKRDEYGNVVSYEYTIKWGFSDCLADNYEVTVTYKASKTVYDEYENPIETVRYSTILINPVVVYIDANYYSKIYDDKAVSITDEGVISNMTVQSLKIDGTFITVRRNLATVGGKTQNYYELVSYVNGKTTVVEKMILRFVDVDTGLTVDEYVDVKRDAKGNAVAYRYNVIGEMLDGALLSNYELDVTYESYDYDDITGDEIEFSRINILPRRIYVTTESKEFAFDSKAHSYPVGKIEAGVDNNNDGILDTGILSHHKKKEADGVWNDYLKITQVGTKTNTVEFNVVASKDGVDKTSNYEIVCTGGKLTVKPITVTLSAKSVKTEYNGKAYDAVGVKSYDKVALFGADKILFARAATSQIDAGKGDTYISIAVIKTLNGYEVYYGDPYRTRTVTYQRKSASEQMRIVVTDGQYIIIGADDTVSYHTYDSNKTTYSNSNASECSNTEEENYSYYEFDNVDGTAIVEKRKITIVCSSETSSGDSVRGTARITVGSMIDGHYLYFPTSGEATEKGVPVANTVRYEDIAIYSSKDMTSDTKLDESVKNNYDFEIIPGELLIK